MYCCWRYCNFLTAHPDVRRGGGRGNGRGGGGGGGGGVSSPTYPGAAAGSVIVTVTNMTLAKLLRYINL